MRPRVRWTPTATAWRLCLFGSGLAAAAVNTGNNLLYLIGSILLAGLPVSLLAARRNQAGVEVDLRLPRAPRAGAPFVVEAVLTNRQPRQAVRGLELRVQTEQAVWGPAWIERLDPGATCRVRIEARDERRGRRRVTGISLASTFPLGLLRRVSTRIRSDDVLFLPARSPGERKRDRPSPLPGQGAPSPRVSGDEYEGLRRGGEREDSRRVDWKTTARRGSLILRETAGEAGRGVELDLATRVAGEGGQARRDFERRLSRLATQAEDALLDGGTVELTVDRAEHTVYRGRRGILPLLTRLARVEPRGGRGAELPALPSPGPARSTSRVGAAAVARTSPAGRAHHMSGLLAIGVGFSALGAYGGIGPALWAALSLSLLATIVAPSRLVARRDGWMRRLWNVAALVGLVSFAVDLLTRGNPLTASLYLLVFITLFQIYNATTPRDDRLLLLLSLLHLVLAAALTTEVTFVLPLLSGMAALVHGQIAWTSMPTAGPGAMRALVWAGGGRGPRYAVPAVAVSAGLVAVGGILFFLVPHLGTGTYDVGAAPARSSSGFSDRTRLGDIGQIKLDATPVMEVELEGPVPDGVDLKWRGAALDSFDGRTWKRTGRPGTEELFVPGPDGRFVLEAGAGELLRQHVRLEPTDRGTLFAAGRPVEVESRDFPLLARDASGYLQVQMRRRQHLSYRVTSRVTAADPARLRAADGDDPREVRAAHLRLPALDPRIPGLADRIVAPTRTRYDAALAIERWLSTRHEYSLDVRDRGRADPLAAFLFDGMAGHCEYFATSMVVLARSAGIPARLATGYLRGERNRFSRRFLVRQSDAHAWVEIHFPGQGWVAFDPTPPAGRLVRDDRGLLDLASDLHSAVRRWWDDYLIGIDLQDQMAGALLARDALERLGRGVVTNAHRLPLVALPLALLWLGAAWLRRARAARRGTRRAPAFYRRMLRILDREGLSRAASETPAEIARRSASRLAPDRARRVRRLTELYYRVRFDGRTAESDVDGLARAILAELQNG